MPSIMSTSRRFDARQDAPKIVDLDLFLIEIPRATPLAGCRSLLVRLVTDSGLEGWGEAGPIWRANELVARHDSLLPLLSDRRIFDIEELLRLDALTPAPLCAALEMASWDLIGRAAGEPLCHLLGGVYRQRVPLAVRLSDVSADQIATSARALAEQGFHCQVISASGDRDRDLETLAIVRDSVGDRAELRFDIAGVYEYDTAYDLCNELANEGLQFVMDPIPTTDVAQLLIFAQQVSVPLAVTAPVDGPAEMIKLAQAGLTPCVIVDLAKQRGLWPARQCSIVAQAARMGTLLKGAPTVGVAAAAMLQLAAATPAFSGANECDYHQLQNDVLVEPLEIVDGMIAVPQGPGLGVEIDRAKLDNYQVA